MVYRILLGINVVAALVLVYFFLAGLADGSVSSFNMGLWLGLLGATASVLAGGYALHKAGHRRIAGLVLAAPAVPVVGYVVFLLVVIVSGERWN